MNAAYGYVQGSVAALETSLDSMFKVNGIVVELLAALVPDVIWLKEEVVVLQLVLANGVVEAEES